MARVKVLTVQFDVTNLPDKAIEELRFAACAQGEDIFVMIKDNPTVRFDAEVLNTSVREVDTDDN